MTSVLKELARIVRTEMLSLDGVARVSPSRRFASLYSEGSPADSLYFLESGLVKTYKRGEESKEIILDIILPGELFGIHALGPIRRRQVSAEILQEGVIHVISRDLFLEFCDARPYMWRLLADVLLVANRQLEKKIELLCLQDVEYRILHYVAQLAEALGPEKHDDEHSVPLSQGELACLIGATRETTSTMLNSLARRGILRLGRRQLGVPSLETVRAVVSSRSAGAAPGL